MATDPHDHSHHHDHDHHHGHDHDHHHGHNHPHDPIEVTEGAGEYEIMVHAIKELLIEKGVITGEDIRKTLEFMDTRTPALGAKVIARAWTDPEFKKRLLEDGTKACAELGIGGLQGEDMVVVENTDTVHNAIVCTLCSCYPWPALGLPPNWYKQPAYRSRMVREPRKVLREDFGFDIPDSVEIRIWDSSSEMRYWVLPKRPEGTDGMSEKELAELVTRDSMIGVGPTRRP
jgi:nitrile hydratase subunit alpha